MGRKLFSLDLDGTILYKNHISLATQKVIMHALNEGNIVMLNSGRPLHHMKALVETFKVSRDKLKNFYIASDNGCSLIDCRSNKIFFYKLLDNSIVKALWNKAAIDGLNPFNHNESITYYYKLTPYVERLLVSHKKIYPKLKKVCQANTLDDKENISFPKFTFIDQDREEYAIRWLNLRAKEHNLTPVHSERTFYMLSSKGYTKAKPIKKLQKMLNIDKNDVYVFGDSDNDIEAFSTTSNIVVPSSGAENIKKMAKFIVGRIEDDGVAKFLENLINKNK